MSEIAELERRITAALERIGRGIEGLVPPPAVAPPAPEPVPVPAPVAPAVAPAQPDPEQTAELARLRRALDDEKALTAQLQDKLRAARDRDGSANAQTEQRIERMTRQLDVQGLELQRMRKTAVTLREQLRAMRQAQAAGAVDAHLINKAMMTELEALRATRLTEMAEMDDIIGELTHMVTEAENA